MDYQSCKGLKAIFKQIDFINNNQNGSITCNQQNSCEDMNIYIDDTYTKININMNEYSQNIQIHDSIGFIEEEGILNCGTVEYIQYDFGYDGSISQLIEELYSNNLLPCQDIIYDCINNKTGNNGSCILEYEYIDKSIIEATQSGNSTCTNVLIQDIVTVWCYGNCNQSPTRAPTLSPSLSPTLAPSISPSNAPTLKPTFSPSFSPILPPTNPPTTSPTPAPTAEPTETPTEAPTKSPTKAPVGTPTAAPTFGPTQAPTRDPTINTENLDTKIDIIYKFTGLTDDNYYDIWYYVGTDTIEKMEEIIEMSYYSKIQTPKYSGFSVVILKINGIDYLNNEEEFTTDLLYGKETMTVDSEILFENKYSDYFLVTSKSEEFNSYASNNFKEYFDNKNITFTVDNVNNLKSVSLNEINGIDDKTILWIITGLLLGSVMLIIIASTCSAMYKKQLLLPVDNANWISLIYLLLCIWDVFTNINLTIYIFSISDRKNYDIIYLIGMFLAVFMGFRILLNLCFAWYVEKKVYNNHDAVIWLNNYKWTFIFLVVLTGGNFFPVLYVLSSNLFGLKITNSGVTLIELNGLYLKRNKILLVILLVECLPPLIAQYVIFGSLGLPQSLLLSMTSTLLFFIIYNIFVIVNQIETKREGKRKNVSYYLEVRLNKNDKENKKLKKSYIAHIKNKKGLKSQLKKRFIELYPAQYLEIGGVTIQKKGFVIRFVHYINKKDSKDYMDKLYATNSSQVNDIIFTHFCDLDQNMFKILYHKKFPSLERRMSSRNATKRVSGRRLSFTMDDNALKNDGIGAVLYHGRDDDDDDNKKNDYRINYRNNNSYNNTESGSEEMEEKQLEAHRMQFRKAVSIIGDEREKGNNDYNRLVYLLQEHDIDYAIIDDVLKYGTKTGLFNSKNDSDIDNSDDSEHGGYVSSAGRRIEMMEIEHRNRQNDSDDDVLSSGYED